VQASIDSAGRLAVPLLVRTHKAHEAVSRWWGGREVALSGHALAETYSALTRLPRDVRLAPADAARLLHERFVDPLLLGSEPAGRLPALLSERREPQAAATSARSRWSITRAARRPSAIALTISDWPMRASPAA